MDSNKLLQYAADKHVRDIKGVLLIQGDAIDFDYLDEWAKYLGVVDQLEHVLGDM